MTEKEGLYVHNNDNGEKAVSFMVYFTQAPIYKNDCPFKLILMKKFAYFEKKKFQPIMI